MSQTLTYVIGSDRRTNVDNIQDFKVDFGDDNNNWVQARQFERGMRQVFVNVTNADGTPFDLTGCNVWFEGLLPKTASGDFRVIDSDGYVPLDPSAGKFRFDMPGQAFTVAGSYRQAFFRILKNGNSVTTLEFDLDVLADKVIDGLVPKDWIGPFETIADQLVDDLQNHTNAADKIISDFQQKVTDLVNQLNQQGSTTTSMLTELQNRITALEAKITQDGLFTQAEADAFKQAIQKSTVITFDTVGEMKQATVAAGQYTGTRGYYAVGDGGNANYLITNEKPNNGWSESLQNGLYAKLILPTMINPAQFGAYLNGNDSDYQAVQAAVNTGNVAFEQGSQVVIDSPIVLPQEDRIIDFNKSNIRVKNGALIKAGSNNDTTYHHSFVIKNANLQFDAVTAECSAFSIFNTYDIKFENITVENAVDNVTVFDFNDCFNLTVDNCFVGTSTGSLNSTAGIRIRETNIPNSHNNFPNNTTNLKITNCLMQNLDRGYDLNGTGGMIDTAVIDNCGASSCNYGYVISGAGTTVGVSLRNCRSELAKKANILLDSDATISDFHSYSDGSTPVGIEVTNNAMYVVFLGYISFDGHYSENAFTCAGAVNASSAMFRIFNGENINLKNVVFPWRPDIISGSLSKLNNFMLYSLKVLCVDNKFDISQLSTTGVSDGIELLVTMQNTGNTYKLIYHNGWHLQNQHLNAVNTEGATKLNQYYQTPNNPFIAPCDGYVTLQSPSDTDIWQLNMKEEMMLRAKDDIVSMMVKKGMDMYLTSTGSEGAAYFIPIESN